MLKSKLPKSSKKKNNIFFFENQIKKPNKYYQQARLISRSQWPMMNHFRTYYSILGKFMYK